MSLNFVEVAQSVSKLGSLKYFPAEPGARTAIVDLIGEMATSMDQVNWLIKRMTGGLYEEWPGPRELRACFCSRFPPHDGINAYSSVYPDGIPASNETAWRMQIPAGATKQPAQIEAPPEYAPKIAAVAAAKTMRIPKIPTGHNVGFKPVTQADIDRVLRERAADIGPIGGVGAGLR